MVAVGRIGKKRCPFHPTRDKCHPEATHTNRCVCVLMRRDGLRVEYSGIVVVVVVDEERWTTTGRLCLFLE